MKKNSKVFELLTKICNVVRNRNSKEMELVYVDSSFFRSHPKVRARRHLYQNGRFLCERENIDYSSSDRKIIKDKNEKSKITCTLCIDALKRKDKKMIKDKKHELLLYNIKNGINNQNLSIAQKLRGIKILTKDLELD